ncbi:MAG: KpsF/GutQ family sugar-phosphate isomerase [Sneathiellaceae bacterium]
MSVRGTRSSTAIPATAARMDHIASARRVLRMEAEALQGLAENLDEVFSQVVDLLAAVPGRVIISGIGKSGHIARKIAATMASTGTPAQYVHPNEASHGDLGMITPQDAVLCLSNSGESRELTDLISHSRRFGIPLIGMVRRPGSTLAQEADLYLLVPEYAEACPLGLAPTTSTTMMLALGDALAIALLEKKGFTTDDFRVLHPGGKLGTSLIRVADIMHAGEEMPLIHSGATMGEAILVMTAKKFGCVGVTDKGGALVGIVTDGDLRRAMGDDLLQRRVDQVMTPRPVVIRQRALAVEAINLMNSKPCTALFVVDDRVPVGFLEIHDCLRAGVS